MMQETKVTELLESHFSIELTQPASVKSVSQTVKALLGFSSDKFLNGKISLPDLIHSHDQDIADELFSTNVETTSGTFNIRIRHADGRIRCIKGQYTKDVDSNQNSIILNLVLQDAKMLWKPQAIMANYTAIMDNTDDYIYFKDRNHVFTGASHTLVSLTNPSEHWSDLLGKTDYDVFPEEFADIYYRLEKQVFSGFKVAHEIQEILDHDGNKGWVDNRKYPIYGKSGEIIGLFGIARDITSFYLQQQKLKELLAEQAAIIDNNLVGVVTACNRKVVWANRTYEKMLGYDKHELISCPTRQFYAYEEDYIAVGIAYVNLQKEGVIRNELEFVCKDGSHIWVDIRGAELDNIIADSIWIIVDVTERKKAEIALKESEYYWKFAIEGAGDGVWDWNIENDIKTFSDRWKAILGYDKSDILPIGIDWENRIHPDDALLAKETMHAYLSGIKSTYKLECRMRCKDGSFRWVLSRGMVVEYGEDGTPIRMIGTISDITERKQAEHDLHIAAIAFESQEGMMVTDANNVILQVNKAFTTITGYTASDAIGQKSSLLSSGRHDALFFADMWVEIKANSYWEGEIWNKRKDGEVYPQQLTITAVRDDDNIVTNYVGTLTDITESKLAEQEIKDLAYYDTLTHLPNRRLMIDRIRHSLSAKTRKDGISALLFLDLDHFKTLNDTLGHDMGDVLLQQVATRLVSCVRENDTVSRFGGDEFVVFLEDLSKTPIDAAAQVKEIANKLLDSVSNPYQLSDYSYTTSTSIGITLLTGDKLDVDELLKQADIAMYQAKKDGRNNARFFDPRMQTDVAAHAKLEQELKDAISNQQFRLFYQLQIDNRQRPFGAEALIRWMHPERGLVYPSDFMSQAEQSNAILAISQWLIDVTCAQLKSWEKSPFTQELTLSVNISEKQFYQQNFISQIADAVQRYDINPSLLTLELTESILFEDIAACITKLNALSALKINFSIDNFGMGYSSVQHLRRLPLNQLKIDKSFVNNITTDVDDQAVVKTIISMASSLGLSVIAEGIETKEQQQWLLANGCIHYQGDLFNIPLPISELELVLKQYFS